MTGVLTGQPLSHEMYIKLPGGGVSPVTGRVRPLTRSTAPRPAGGPPFPRAALRTPVGDVRQLRGGERD
ncbi:hypothetical protein F9S60_24210 [Escherichia coli]|nr:hypothetical protein [Escherichia coli]